MLRSMFSGVSGLRAHTTMLDVVSNNISNVNTSGFKASRATFQEAISQILRGSSGTNVVRAGINPVQLGLGVNVAAIDGIFTQGATQLTGRNTDIAIQGEGFFVVDAGGETRYTRSGAFSLDAQGNFVGPTGAVVQGWLADDSGAVNFNDTVTNLRLPSGQTIAPIATELVELGGNLPVSPNATLGAATADLTDYPADPTYDGTIVSTSITVYDTLGEAQRLTVEFHKTDANNEWHLYVTQPDNTGDDVPELVADFVVEFDVDGTLLSVGGVPGATQFALPPVDWANGSDTTQPPIVLDFDASIPAVQFGGANTIEARDQDGQGIGLLRGFAIGNDGALTGQFSNGEAKILGYIALARFNNPGGLIREGESMFSTSGNSGVALTGPPGDNGTGLLSAGALEMSNVDLAQEFTHLIIAQRGFQANSRSITTSDEVLAELVNIKR